MLLAAFGSPSPVEIPALDAIVRAREPAPAPGGGRLAEGGVPVRVRMELVVELRRPGSRR